MRSLGKHRMMIEESIYFCKASAVSFLVIGALTGCGTAPSLPTACEAKINSVFPLFKPDNIEADKGFSSRSQWADFYVRLTQHHRRRPTDYTDTTKVRIAGEAFWDARSESEAYSGTVLVKDLEETETNFFQEITVEYEFMCLASVEACDCYFVPENE